MNAKLIDEVYEERTALHDSDYAEDIVNVEPADEPDIEADEHSTLGLIELLLKSPLRVDRLARDEARQAELIPRFLAIVLLGFSVFSLALVLLLNQADARALPEFLRAR